MPREYMISPSPMRASYVKAQGLNPSKSLTYVKKVYGSTVKPAAWPAASAGIYYNLLFESTGKLLLEDGTSALRLESSDSASYSIIYLFSTLDPVLYGGVAIDTVSGSSVGGLALAFPKQFFHSGDSMTFDVQGKVTSNSLNSSLVFTFAFPHSGSAATLSMPATVGVDKLVDFGFRVTSVFGYDTNGNGTVMHSGQMTVHNSDVTALESTSVMVAVQNTLDYDTILYYLPTVAWTTQAAGNSVDFYSASLTVT